MQQAGLRNDQVSQVRGFADQHLRNPKDALDPRNRRVSIIVQYINMDPADAAADGKDDKESEAGKSSTAGEKESPPASKK